MGVSLNLHLTIRGCSLLLLLSALLSFSNSTVESFDLLQEHLEGPGIFVLTVGPGDPLAPGTP